MESDANMQFRRQLFSINQDLVSEEVAALKFLCTDLLPPKKLERVKSAADIFDLLINQAYLSEGDTFLAAELLYRIKSHSLLPKLGYTKEEVQECLHEKGRVSLYRQMLYELSEGMASETVKNIIFLLQNRLPKRWTTLVCEEGDKCACSGKTALDLLTLLEKQDLLGENNVQILEDVLRKVSPDLLKTINSYKEAKDNKAPNLAQAIPERSLELRGAFSNVKNESKEKKTIYKMDGPHRGFCVVINNVEFKSFFERKGSFKDAEELKRVFTWLGLDVRIYTNKTSEQIIKLMETWQRLQDHEDRNCFICCILSHGKSGAIYGTDEKPVLIHTITSHFTATKCPQLAGKPKLFFIQACRGEKRQHPVNVEVDARTPDSSSMQQSVSLHESIPEDADFLLGLATVDGCVSFRHIQQGSWYIQALCRNLELLVPRGEDILTILTEVNKDVASHVNDKGEKQMPQPAYTLRGKVIFPKPPPSKQHQGI